MYQYVKMYVKLLCVRSTTGNILLGSMTNLKWNGNYLFNSASLSLVGDNSLVHKLRLIAAVEIYLNAIYGQHLALKSVYEKWQ